MLAFPFRKGREHPDCPCGLPSEAFARRRVGGEAKVAAAALGAALSRGRILRLVKEMCMLDEIRAKRDETYAIAKKHKVERLWVFGSCVLKNEG